MTTKIRFNPMSKEVELEGTEEFVEKHFKAIQELFASLRETAVSQPVARSTRTAKKEKSAPASRKSSKSLLRKGEIYQTVVSKVRESNTGMTTDSLMKETGFSLQQVRSVIFRAEKQGVIRRLQRGVYEAAENTAELAAEL